MTDFNGERFMIKVILLAVGKNLVHDNWMAKCDVKVRQTLHVLSDSPGIECIESISFFILMIYSFDTFMELFSPYNTFLPC